MEEYSQNFKRFFKGFNPDVDTDFEISNSACWERKRSQGGSRGQILDFANDHYGDNEIEKEICNSLIRDRINSVLHKMIEVSPGKVEELRGVRSPVWQDLMTQMSPKPKAMVAAILEPLKVRLITKGPCMDYYLSKSYQKSLFKYLRRFPQFELIGDPLRPDHIYRMIDRELFLKERGMNFSHFVSGDYSAATDNLKIAYTKLGLETSFENLPLSLKEAYRNTLYEHEIHYPKKFGIEPFMQQSGQLMGSPLSFPFLCLNNLIAYKLSLEDHLGISIPFKHLPCLVNGDDILFRTNPTHYELWKQRVASIGFDLSIGKNYIHEKVLTINSQCFTYSEGTLHQVNYCNFGLLSGSAKIGSQSRGEVRDKALDLCENYIKSVGGSIDKQLSFTKFLSRNSEDISKITHHGRYNLFLPRVLGGFGLPIYEGITFHVTRFQACLAKYIRKTLDTTIVGFKSDVKSNSIKERETRNKKKFLIGYGPLNESERVLETKTHVAVNSSYLPDITTKFFTKLPIKWTKKVSSKIFGDIKLGSNPSKYLDLESSLFRLVSYY